MCSRDIHDDCLGVEVPEHFLIELLHYESLPFYFSLILHVGHYIDFLLRI